MTSHQRDPDAWPPRGRIFTWKRAGAAMVALLLCVPLWLWIEGRSTRRMIEAIRARGEPTTWAELEAWRPAVAPERDAARLWLGAARALDDPELGPGRKFAAVPIVGSEAGDAEIESTWTPLDLGIEFLDTHAASLEQLHAAARIGGAARFPINFRPVALGGPDLNFLQDLRQPARCLALEAGVRMRRGDAAGAVESIDALAKLGQPLDGGQLMVMQLVGIAISGMADAEARRLLEQGALDGPQLARLAESFDPIVWQDCLQDSLIAERVWGIDAFEDPAALGVAPGGRALLRLIRHRDEREYLTAMARMIEACAHPPQEAAALVAQIVSDLNALGPLCPLTKLLTPAFEAEMNATMRAAASRQIVLLAIALERFRRAHGRPPASLDELVPELLDAVPLDAATQQPIGYRTEGADGYVVYSPWKGAANATFDPATGADDRLFFRWPPPPPRVEAEQASEQADAGEDAGNAAAQE